MSIGPITLSVPHRLRLSARISDYVELTKPRIVLLELVTVIVGMYLAAPGQLTAGLLAATVIGTTLTAASASILNQWLERDRDGRMERTADRPLPTGRIGAGEAVFLGAATFAAGIVTLALGVNWSTALVGVLCWTIYVVAYTPMKTRSTLNTAIGAASGALPILMGWTAGGGSFDLVALGLVGVLYLWQFPHFMAIAWLYRRDYAAAGYQMATVDDPSGLRAGAIAVSGALALLPISLVPALAPHSGSPLVYCVWAVILGLLQLATASMFLAARNDQSARRLLRASLVYLPCWLGLLLMVNL
ncbi:MAG: heme o synthase [Pirellulales bacterium]